MKTNQKPGNTGLKNKADLNTCSIDELVRLIKTRACKITEVPIRRVAQVNAFKRKEKTKPDLSKSKVAALKAMVENREKQLTEIPLQRRIQIKIKMDQEEALRKYYEDNPD